MVNLGWNLIDGEWAYSLALKALPLTQRDFVDLLGEACPRCQSTEIEGEMFEIKDGQALQPFWCANCEASWNAVYNLERFKIINAGVFE